jgi:hypothetical protein
MINLLKTLPIVLLAAAATPAAAVTMVKGSYEFTAPEYNGDGSDGRVLVASWLLTLLPDERITSARFTSSFGNSFIDSSSTGVVTVNGIEVGRCDGPGDPCWDGPGRAFSYDFPEAQFAALLGPIDLAYDQTDCCVIRLGESRLTILTERGVIPEPATWAMLIAGFGLVGMAVRRRGQLPRGGCASQPAAGPGSCPPRR